MKKKKMKMKANGSEPSLSSLISSLCDSIGELIQLTSTLRMDGELSITGLLAVVATFKSTELQFQAIRDLLRQRKEAIPKGKISSFFNFTSLFDIKMAKSEMETLQGIVSHSAEIYMNMARTLHLELFSDDTNLCLIQEEANNGTDPEAMVISPSPAEDIQQNNQLQNEPEPLRRESKTDNSWFGKRRWIGSCMKGKERI